MHPRILEVTQRLVERSRFERIDGRWDYRDGDLS